MNVYCRAAIAAICLAGMAAAQEAANLNGDSAQTRKRLAEAEQKLIDGKSAEATDDLQRVIDEAGDDFIAIDGKQYRTARWLAHGILARLPADALKSYRDRIDDPAGRLLATAKKSRETAPLWQLLDRYFVSRPAGEGILLLGDLLFEKGEFRAAERQWRRLIPGAGADVEYPEPKTDPAAVRARVILAMIFQGDTERAGRELAEFRMKHPMATGDLAGKTGPYAEALQKYLEQPPIIPAAANAGKEWPTFGGGPERSSRLAPRIAGQWPSTPTRKVRIEDVVKRHFASPVGPPGRSPFCHPVVADGHLFLTDGYRLLAYDLTTFNRVDSRPLLHQPANNTTEKPPLEASPSLTAAGGRLYVRIGPGTIKPGDAARDDPSWISCVVLQRLEDGSSAFKQLWRLKPPDAEGQHAAVWEGAPLVAGRRMWVAFSRFEGGRVVHGLACYDPADTAATPDRPAWVADVCDGAFAANEGRARHELLTLAGRNIVLCSNTGAVIALDAVTGKRAWAYRYPRARKPDSRRSAEPTPAVFSAGRIFVAPADADRVLALDPDTGGLLWESGPIEAAQIMGVTAGRVIITSSGPVRGIRGLDVRTGTYRTPAGWIQHDGGGLLSYGKGFVTDDLIVWPTRAGLVFLDPDDGSPYHPEPLNRPIGGATAGCFGHIVYSDGILIVVTPTEVLFYVSDEKRYGSVVQPQENESARGRFERSIQRAERMLAAGETAAARETLLRTATANLPNACRAWAAARLLLLPPKAENESSLPADVRKALVPDLLGEWLIAPDGVPITLGKLLDRHLSRASITAIGGFTSPVRCEPKPENAPTFGADAEISRSLRLEQVAAPLRSIAGSICTPKRFFAISESALLAIPFSERELSRHAASDRFTYSADLGSRFVAAGPFAVAIYATDVEPEWVFRVPTTDPLPNRPGVFRISFGLVPAVAELSSFRIHGSLLVARLGDRHLIAFDLRNHCVAWVLGADGRAGFHAAALPGAARFGPEIGAAGPYLFAQLSSGQRWFIRADCGTVSDQSVCREETAKVRWPHAPVEIGENLVPFADGPGLVRLWNLRLEKAVWVHQEEGEGSLAGDPPQIRAWVSAFFLAVRRNHGVEVDRLDLKDGKSLWSSGPAFLDASRVELAHADADAEHIYVPVGNSILAISLKDGKLAWEARLPESHGSNWIARAGQNGVIVYPENAIPREPVGDVLKRALRSFENAPAAWRLPGLAAGLYDAWIARTVPVLLLDLESGKMLTRVDIPAAGPAISAYFERDLAVVATGDRVVWLR